MTEHIGPVLFTNSNPFIIFDDNNHDLLDTKDLEESFTVVCDHIAAKQLQGLSLWNELFYLNPDDTLTEDLYKHTGWYEFVSPSNPVFYPGTDVKMLNKVRRQSSNPYEILELIYSNGEEDGTVLTSGYEDLAENVLFDEDFSDWNTTTVWNPLNSSGMSTNTITATGGKLEFVGKATTAGVYGGMITQTRNDFETDFICDFDLEWVAVLPANYNEFSLYLTGSGNLTWNNLHNISGATNWLRVMINVTPSAATFTVQKTVNGVTTPIVATQSLTSGQKTPKFRLKYYSSGDMEIWCNKSGTAITETLGVDTRLLKRTNIGLTFKDSVYATYDMTTSYDTNQTFRTDGIKFYNYVANELPNVMSLNSSATLLDGLTSDFTRASENGNIQCFDQTSGRIKFTTNPLNLYNSSVRGYRSNFTDNTSRLVCNVKEETLDPLKYYLTNGVIKITPTSDSLKFYFWDNGTYDFIDELNVGTISTIRSSLIGSNVQQLEVNGITIIMRHGKPYFYMKHPYTDVSYIKKNTYSHDSTTTSNPAADADITMETVGYATIYDVSPIANLTAALARLDGGSEEIVHINIIGDSITEGKYAGDLSSAQMSSLGFLGLLRTYYQGLYGNVGSGLIPTVYHLGVASCPWTFSSSPAWSHGNNWVAGVAGSTYYTNNNAATATITFNGTGFNLLYVKGNGYGTFDYDIDGGTPVTVDCQNATIQYCQVEEITGLSNDEHTLTITKSSDTKYIYLIGGYETLERNNKFAANVETGTDTLGNTTGFTSYGSTITSSSTWAKKDTKSVKVTTNNSVAGEGIYATFTSVPGEDYALEFTIKGTIGNTYRVYLRESGGGSVTFLSAAYLTFTLSEEEETLTYTGTCPAGVTTGQWMVLTHTQRAEDFYLDENYVVDGVEMPDIAGVQVNCCGVSGSTVYGHYHEGPMQTEIDHFQPTLTVIALGANDYGTQVALSDFRSRVQTLITRAKTYGDVAIIPLGMQEPELTIPYTDYVDVLSELADLNNCLYVDVPTVWEDFDNAMNVLNYLYDETPNTIHPNTAGHASINTILQSTIAAGDVAPDTGLMVVKTSPTTIKSDSLPASDLTIIGAYNKVATGYNAPDSIARESLVQTMQKIVIAEQE